jgi:hypothetical protein
MHCELTILIRHHQGRFLLARLQNKKQLPNRETKNKYFLKICGVTLGDQAISVTALCFDHRSSNSFVSRVTSRTLFSLFLN